MKELTKELMCIKLRSGVEIWVEKEKAQKLIDLLGTTKTKFVEIGDEIINSADVEGVFTPQTMDDLRKRKSGKWQCQYGVWHDRYEKCFCWEKEKYQEVPEKDRYRNNL